MQPAQGISDGSHAGVSHPLVPAASRDDMTLDDVRCEVGDRWDITRITAGYRAMIREPGGHTPIPRYGRTPAELAESIRYAEARA
jgi:hypothetical protein